MCAGCHEMCLRQLWSNEGNVSQEIIFNIMCLLWLPLVVCFCFFLPHSCYPCPNKMIKTGEKEEMPRSCRWKEKEKVEEGRGIRMEGGVKRVFGWVLGWIYSEGAMAHMSQGKKDKLLPVPLFPHPRHIPFLPLVWETLCLPLGSALCWSRPSQRPRISVKPENYDEEYYICLLIEKTDTFCFIVSHTERHTLIPSQPATLG